MPPISEKRFESMCLYAETAHFLAGTRRDRGSRARCRGTLAVGGTTWRLYTCHCGRSPSPGQPVGRIPAGASALGCSASSRAHRRPAVYFRALGNAAVLIPSRQPLGGSGYRGQRGPCGDDGAWNGRGGKPLARTAGNTQGIRAAGISTCEGSWPAAALLLFRPRSRGAASLLSTARRRATRYARRCGLATPAVVPQWLRRCRTRTHARPSPGTALLPRPWQARLHLLRPVSSVAGGDPL